MCSYHQRFGIEDEEFLRAKVPMSKEEVRAITLSKCKLFEGVRVLDIGAGSGSLGIAVAKLYQKNQVCAIEYKDDAYELTKKNVEKFELENYELYQGLAPEGLPEKVFDRVIIGGTRSKMKEILNWCDAHLVDGGIIVMNFILLKNVYTAVKLLEELEYEVDVTSVQIARSKPLAGDYMMMAENPISIVRGIK